MAENADYQNTRRLRPRRLAMYGVLLLLIALAGTTLSMLFGSEMINSFVGEASVVSSVAVAVPAVVLGFLILLLGKGFRRIWWVEAYLVSLLEGILIGCGTMYVLALLRRMGSRIAVGWPLPLVESWGSCGGGVCWWRLELAVDSVFWAIVTFVLCFCFNAWLMRRSERRPGSEWPPDPEWVAKLREAAAHAQEWRSADGPAAR